MLLNLYRTWVELLCAIYYYYDNLSEFILGSISVSIYIPKLLHLKVRLVFCNVHFSVFYRIIMSLIKSCCVYFYTLSFICTEDVCFRGVHVSMLVFFLTWWRPRCNFYTILDYLAYKYIHVHLYSNLDCHNCLINLHHF